MSELFLDTPLSAGNHATFRSLSTMEDFWKVNLAHWDQTPSTFSAGSHANTQTTTLSRPPLNGGRPPSLKIHLNNISQCYNNKMFPTFFPKVHRGAFPQRHVLEVWYNNKSLPDNQSPHLLREPAPRGASPPTGEGAQPVLHHPPGSPRRGAGVLQHLHPQQRGHQPLWAKERNRVCWSFMNCSKLFLV